MSNRQAKGVRSKHTPAQKPARGSRLRGANLSGSAPESIEIFGHATVLPNSRRTKKPKLDKVREMAQLSYEGVEVDRAKVIGTVNEWLEEASDCYNTLVFAIEAIRSPASKNADFAGKEWKAVAELLECITSLKTRYASLGSLLAAAEARVMVGMAHAACAEDTPQPPGVSP